MRKKCKWIFLTSILLENDVELLLSLFCKIKDVLNSIIIEIEAMIYNSPDTARIFLTLLSVK